MPLYFDILCVTLYLYAGVVLHELLRLSLPFSGATTADLVKAIVSDDPPSLPGHYSEDLRVLCYG